jgi:glycogen debranching enzyme
MIEECFEHAKDVLKGNITSRGIIAGREYYNDVWGRDGLITSLGMSFSEDEKLVSAAEKTINNISKLQKANGQLPNKFPPKGGRAGFGEGGCVDTSMWYPIAVLAHYKATGNKTFLKGHAERVEKAVSWVSCLDVNDDFLLETTDGADWMDLLLRSGRVLYNQVLYYQALKSADAISSVLGRRPRHSGMAKNVKESINLFFWPEQKNLGKVRKRYGYTGVEKDFETLMPEGEKDYYYAEIGFRKFDPRCDAFANTLAIMFGVTDNRKERRILDYIEREGIHTPYPIKVLHPPILPDDFFRPFHFRWTEIPHLQEPGSYHNGGIWPFAGGFYIMALKKTGRDFFHPIEMLARANKTGKHGDWEFNEWLTSGGKPLGSAHQSWSAGMYVLAYQYTKGKAKI